MASFSGRKPNPMKALPTSRPCAEFPCDNRLLQASSRVLSETTDAPPDVHVVRADDFDWDETEYWVKELKRRWSLAKADAPEVNWPVLDLSESPPTATSEARMDGASADETVTLGDALLLADSGVLLGELLVMPSEVLFDEEQHVLTADAVTLELRDAAEDVIEVVPRRDALNDAELDPFSDAKWDPFSDAAWDPFSDAESDPFIDELRGLISRDVSDAGEFPELEGSGEVRSVPRVAESKHEPATPVRLEEVPVKHGAQPLLPLQLELTPTPAVVSGWVELTNVVSRYLLNAGHTRAAALLPPLLNGELVDLSRLPAAAIERLVTDSVAETRSDRTVTTATFRDSAKGFREAFCEGGLDAEEALFWLGQVVAAVSGRQSDEAAIEAKLRELGVVTLLERAA